jgi:hypothetical protein
MSHKKEEIANALQRLLSIALQSPMSEKEHVENRKAANLLAIELGLIEAPKEEEPKSE